MAGTGFIYPFVGSSVGGGGGGGGGITVYESAVDPTVDNDSADTAALGETFATGALWLNTVTTVMWRCLDDSVGAAVWNEHIQSEDTPVDNSVVRFDGTDGVHIQSSGWVITDAGDLMTTVDGGMDIGAAAATRPGNVYASASISVGNGGFSATSGGVLGATGGTLWVNDITFALVTDGAANLGGVAGNRFDRVYAKTLFNVGNGGLTMADTGTISASGGAVIIADDNLTWTSDNVGNIGAAAATRPANVYAATSVNVGNGGVALSTTAVTGSAGWGLTSADTLTGLGATTHLTHSIDQEMAFISTNAGRDVADGVVFASVFDRNAASITNAGSVRVHSFGWTNNANAYTELASVRGDGDIYVTGGYVSGAAWGYFIDGIGSFDAGSYSTGLSGNTMGIRNPSDRTTILLSTNTARDAADAICTATVFDRNAASITNADTVRLHSFGWTNNVDAYTEVASVRADGDLHITGSLYGGWVPTPTDISSGLGTTVNFYASTDTETLITNTGRTVGSGNISTAIGADLRSDAPTADHVVIGFGYTNLSDAWNSLWEMHADGSLNAGSAGSAQLTGTQADGAAAIGVILDTSTTYSTSGAKLLSVRNNGTEEWYTTYDGNIEWNADGGGAIGASGANRPSNVYVTTSVFAGTSLNIASGGAIVSDADISSGLGATSNLYTSDDQEVLITNTGRTMGSGNISVAIGGDLNSDTPTADHILVQIGYTQATSDTWVPLWNFEADGALVSADTGSATVTGDIADGAGSIVHTLDSSNTMSTAGSKLLSVQNNTTEVLYIDKDGDCVSDTIFVAADYVQAGAAGTAIYIDADNGGVQVTGRELYTDNASDTLQIHSAQSEGAGNISIALDANVDNATIDEDHIIADFGWIDDNPTRTSSIAIKPNSVIRFVSSWAVAGAPTGQEGDMAYVSNGDAGSKCMAVFDGTNWLRVVLGAAISAT